jgi:hypothetical protein
VEKTERLCIWILSAVAAVRVFAFVAAFPFFNNVDERAHVDLVFKYANGEIPHGLPTFSPAAARYLWLYASPEYFMEAKASAENDFGKPFWTLPREQIDEIGPTIETQLQSRINHEASDPPLYYTITGLWVRLGRWFGLRGGYLLYWIRFLNIPVAAALVWIAYFATRQIFPDAPFLRMAVPTLTAFFPQDNLYSVQSDAWSPLWFGLAFLGILKLLDRERPTVGSSALAGLALSAACLTKTVNLPLLAVAACFVLWQSLVLFRERKIAPVLPAFVTFGLCSILPVIAWIAWNYHAFGDALGTAAKVEYLGWRAKPITAWWPHPIFSLGGVREFWSELIASFWRGELIWHGQRLASSVADGFYCMASTFALAIAAGILLSRTTMSIFQRRALWFSLISFAALAIFLAALSTKFDFGKSIYPSREHPYLISGRLLSAATIPFLLIYACAIDRVGKWAKNKWLSIGLCSGTVLIVMISELIVNAPVFGSRYNFFHLSVANWPL